MNEKNMKKFLITIIILFSLVFLNCITLTKGGSTVRRFIQGEPPTNCIFVGDVLYANCLYTSYYSIHNDLRNKAYELGGNVVVIDSDSSYGGGIGRAYKCKNVKLKGKVKIPKKETKETIDYWK